MLWKIIGSLAAVLTSFAFVPQVVKTLKTKTIKDVSPVALFQLTAGVLLWIIYGIYLNDFIIIIANSVTLTTLLVLICLYFLYNRQPA